MVSPCGYWLLKVWYEWLKLDWVRRDPWDVGKWTAPDHRLKWRTILCVLVKGLRLLEERSGSFRLPTGRPVTFGTTLFVGTV